MGLVDYNSDSDSSGGETAAAPAPAPTPQPKAPSSSAAATGKKPFQKLVDRANPGKIIVSLQTAAATEDDSDGPPAKRAKIGAAGGTSRFSGFGSFLPPPKKAGAATASSSSKQSSTTSTTTSTTTSSLPKPGIHLKTSGEAAFRRATDDDDSNADNEAAPTTSKLKLPPPKAPSIPEGQKAAEDVKLVGNPLMFMPLSVSRKPGKKPKKAGATKTTTTTAASTETGTEASTAPAPQPKKISLFSIAPTEEEKVDVPLDEEEDETTDNGGGGGGYQPMFQDYTPTGYATAQQEQIQQQQQLLLQQQQQQQQYAQDSSTSLGALADDLQLSAKDRRALFGRDGPPASVKPGTITTFDLDREYRHNEALRQSGELEAQVGTNNPVKAIAPGKHSLQQLVRSVHSQRDALEETFAKNRASQRESGGRYGWR